jgi:hypothetical protein
VRPISGHAVTVSGGVGGDSKAGANSNEERSTARISAPLCPAVATHWADANIPPAVTSRRHFVANGWQVTLINTTHA